MTTVVVADDQDLVRSGLELVLTSRGCEVVGTAADGREAVEVVRRTSPDVVLMDIRMPVMSGLDATRTLHQRADPPAVVVLTTFDADDHVVSAVAAGADGFLLKDTPPDQIVDAVRKVAGGEAMLSASATRSLLSRLRNDPSVDRQRDAEARLARLTERELEVGVAVARGLSNAEVASELYLSVPTVKAHVSRLLDKLECANRVQVAMVVHDAGLV